MRTLSLLCTLLLSCSSEPNPNVQQPNGSDDTSVTTEKDAGSDAADVAGHAPQPLYVFTNIHTHLQKDYQPYTDASLETLDPAVWQNIQTTINRASTLYKAYAIPVNWHASYGILKAGCRGQKRLLELAAQGDQVGIHTHKTEEIERAHDMAVAECGFSPTAASGLNAALGRLQNPEKPASAWLQLHADRGYSTITLNALGSSLESLCTQFGVGNRMGSEAGSPLFPWKPDLETPDLCSDAGGPLLVLSHAPTPVVDPAEGIKPDILTAAHFEIWSQQLESALAERASSSDSRAAVWGTVWALPFAAPGSDGGEPPDDAFFEALEMFLKTLAAHRDAGRLILATTDTIREAVTP